MFYSLEDKGLSFEDVSAINISSAWYNQTIDFTGPVVTLPHDVLQNFFLSKLHLK